MSFISECFIIFIMASVLNMVKQTGCRIMGNK
jgi:hypothetical protein